MPRKLNACKAYRIRLCSQESNHRGEDIGLRVEKQCNMRLLEHSCGKKNPKQQKCSIPGNVRRSNK